MDAQTARNLAMLFKLDNDSSTRSQEKEQFIVFKPLSETHVPHIHVWHNFSGEIFRSDEISAIRNSLEWMRDSEISFDLAKIRRRLTKFSWRTFVEFLRLPRTTDEIRRISLSLFLHSTDNYCCEYKKLKIPKPYS